MNLLNSSIICKLSIDKKMLKNSDKMQNITEKKQQNLQQRCKNTSQKKVKKKV